MKLMCGNANRPLAKAIADYLDAPLSDVEIERFADGELFVRIDENMRGQDVFIIQPTSEPANDHLMELLIMIDAVRRSSAKRITAVLPYFGYARQDRKTGGRTPISAKLVANLISKAGADRVLTADLHAGQIQGFFNIPVDHLFSMNVLIAYIKTLNLPELMVISPDAGGVERARAFAKRLGTTLAIIDKRREAINQAKAMNIIGDVKGKTAIIVDDMIDTAGTLMESTNALIEAGVREVYACCSHPVLSGPAGERIEKSPLKAIITTNTIPLNDELKSIGKITVLSVAPLLGEAIMRIHGETSISSLFDLEGEEG